jgi:hypothetical protein
MATVVDIIRGLNQAAANGYDSYDPDVEIGLKREEGHPILDSRVIDGFKVRFAANKMMVTYQSEMRLEELHPRNKFENEIDRKFADIAKFLKKEYKKITKESVNLSKQGEPDILVETTSRVHSWVTATQQYEVGGLGDVTSVRKISDRSIDKSFEKQFKDFLELSTDKKPSNDKAPKHPDTPEA